MNAPTLSRRHLLQSASSGIGWLAFSALASEHSALAPKAGHHAARAKRVIFLTMRGGPSHVDLFDHKPELIRRSGASASVNRESTGAKFLGPVHPFKQCGQSGQWITSRYPMLSRHADDMCISNSMHTDLPNHSQAFVQMHTGSSTASARRMKTCPASSR
jgi:hypothetical protein